jgi:hypothetical protein
VGDHHDLYREDAAGAHLDAIRRDEKAQNVVVGDRRNACCPDPGSRPLSEANRISGVVDPDDELT